MKEKTISTAKTIVIVLLIVAFIMTAVVTLLLVGLSIWTNMGDQAFVSYLIYTAAALATMLVVAW